MADQKLERRAFAQKAEVRTNDAGIKTVTGHAAVFNRTSLPIYGMFYEINEPGCFREALMKDSTIVQAVYAHNDATIPFAVFRGGGKPGSMILREDEVGLYCEYEPLDSEMGRSLIKSIERGDTDGMSYSFIPLDEDWREMYNGLPLRRILKADIFDTTATPNPAFPSTDISVRKQNNSLEMELKDYANLIESRSGKHISEAESYLIANELRRRQLQLLRLTL
ncbi:MAG: HK97 family phage prohead protease [Candidatus Melainabacteria bacterium]|nr:MAG: HK97 family phage prohead protease [Candidatus Melainabacteria bacterium]